MARRYSIDRVYQQNKIQENFKENFSFHLPFVSHIEENTR